VAPIPGKDEQTATKYTLELALPAFRLGPGAAYTVYDTFSMNMLWKVAAYCKAVKRDWRLGSLEPEDCVAHDELDRKGTPISVPAHRGVITIEPKPDYIDKQTGEKKIGKGFFVKTYHDPAQPVPLTLKATKEDWDSILLDTPEEEPYATEYQGPSPDSQGPDEDSIPF